MSLPKIQYPIFEIQVPSQGKTLKFRPYLVKEEKILLTAQSSGDKADIVRSLAQIISNCCLDTVSIEDFSTFDIEYLFIKLRAKSVNNKIEITYTSPEDEQQYKIDVNLDDVFVERNPEHTNKIRITEAMEVILKYPKTDMVEFLKDAKDETDAYFKILAFCLHYIVDGNNTINADEQTFEEKESFLEALDVGSFKKLEQFISTMPKIVCNTPYTNNAGEQKNLRLEGLEDFFTFR